ncbi:Glu-tRNA(Gln) amidotransferase GatDE subunit E [Candidatus Pacearchaeota archaeon CG10_big_fil_rev_8_21_14_0_10_35_219]|nr:Glu-tRNA(Gln) amidotransferase subunit GatE [Candidatus Pacearchaeota archaeon]OIO42757.1 MAG: glutamyl-tRNA(Gln) amidotransferase subunit E [Candidatus Pacearchaeota archaeon CG1_02_35_32]PIO08225.1 MAG: Glu-tRNA(Gln) amidotransferase GatDE subunit E [Candidatus Pacearchaeota archaeon CG10_big_fil_rev_8_21_14_0_10_35_219]PIY81735.1 MAG: Glu-tRNA(Gln) amidotransferase GatDE subunit E [Candidatus Pacearchaeota archaeon CG_4_10_14_0_8_um_filter_35_169]PIZ80361.1 MAG: Glu-tRNA(Gln) amidotransfe
MDYKKLGFKAGLEIHQQLDSNRKLFSDAPNFLRSDKPDFIVKRKLHAVAGEEGKIDVAVQHESSLKKEFVYEGYHDTTSLVELDEEPPHTISEEALNICLQITLLLNCTIYPVSQVMRKTVIDGSNTSGFQRTVLIAHSGFIETGFGKVGIESIALEEDAARIIKRGKEKDVYRLDRLGIPLIEITTSPDMKNPEQIKEAALKIGEILRACKVKRGIGTIRQDVNVSIRGHDRVEIKGFQDPKMMVKTVDLEIERQQKEIKKGETIGCVRNALSSGESEFLRPLPGKARMYPETDLDLLRIGKARLDKVSKNLPKLRSDIKQELKKTGLTDEMVNLILADNRYVDEFLALIKVYGKDANLIARMIVLWRKEFSTKYKKPIEEIKEDLSEAILEKILERVDSGEIDGRDAKEVMEKIIQGKNFDEVIKIEKANDDDLEKEIRKIIKDKPGLRENAYMGLVMKRFKGKVDAKKAMEIIQRVLGGFPYGYSKL